MSIRCLGDLTQEHVGQVLTFRHYRGALKSVKHHRGATSLRPITDVEILYREGSSLRSALVEGTPSGTACVVEPDQVESSGSAE